MPSLTDDGPRRERRHRLVQLSVRDKRDLGLGALHHPTRVQGPDPGREAEQREHPGVREQLAELPMLEVGISDGLVDLLREPPTGPVLDGGGLDACVRAEAVGNVPDVGG